MSGDISMSTLTIRLPDDKHERLKLLAKSNSISVNRLIDELATVALANFDAKVRFETRASRGNPARALALLDKLDLADKSTTNP
jgi:predicted DNA-binding ribbon-helix-helix protein